MKNHISLLISIIWIPFLIVWWYYFFGSQTLPIEHKRICVYPVFADWWVQKWVVSYRGSGLRVTAWHVIDPELTKDSPLLNGKDFLWYGFNQVHMWNDIGLIEFTGNYKFNEKICIVPMLDGLLTYENWEIKKVPVEISGTFIQYDPSYGQSWSPVFRDWKIIWVISRKYDGWSVVSLLP